MLPFVGDISKNVLLIHKALTLVFTSLVFMYAGKSGVSSNKILLGLWMPIVYLTVYGLSPMQMVECAGLIALWMLREDQQALAFEKFVAIFAVILIINSLAYPFAALGLLHNFGAIIPDHWLKQATGIFYDNLGITFVIHEENALNISTVSAFYRMSAWFEEPGNVGTMAALMLGATRFRMDWKGKALLVGGMLSFSLAFYAMCIFYNVLKHPKNLLYVVIIGMCFAWFFQDNEFVSARLLDRVSITDGGISGDNRAEESFKVAFEQYVQTPTVWLGHDANNQLYKLHYNVFSWQNLVWDYGIVGTLMYLSLFVIVFYQRALATVKLRRERMWQSLPFIMIFLMSIYQRPYVLSLSFVLIFVGAMCVKSEVGKAMRKSVRYA